MNIWVAVRIENRYELHEDVVTEMEATIPPPPADPAEMDEWAFDHLYPLTGVGHVDGDSWYDLEITASSDLALVGRTFDWGY